MCVPEQRVGLAQTFLTGGAASLWRAKSAVLQAQGFDIQDWDVFARTLEQAFGHQDPEQNARDKLDALKQTGSVEDFADKFQSLVAEIVAMPLSEGDLLQKFKNGQKPDIQMVASIDPVTGTRWMNLQKFISFACATDASRAQANKGKQASEKSEQGKSSSSGATYKDKLKARGLMSLLLVSQPRRLRQASRSRSQNRRQKIGSTIRASFAIRKVTGLRSALTGLRILEWILRRPSKGQ
jgi:hypothetical protein